MQRIGEWAFPRFGDQAIQQGGETTIQQLANYGLISNSEFQQFKQFCNVAIMQSQKSEFWNSCNHCNVVSVQFSNSAMRAGLQRGDAGGTGDKRDDVATPGWFTHSKLNAACQERYHGGCIYQPLLQIVIGQGKYTLYEGMTHPTLILSVQGGLAFEPLRLY